MEWVTPLLIIVGLSLFEIISSIDNAIINAEVLHGMKPWARRWFLTWGLFFAVFLMRGLLPFIIVFALHPNLGLWHTFVGVFTSNPAYTASIKEAAPLLLMGGGVFLILLFLHWVFLEPKFFGIRGERRLMQYGVWFYAIASLFLTFVVWESLKIEPYLALSAVIGSTAFFITHGFKQQAEEAERKLLQGKRSGMSDWSKIFYLEAIDATFSIDGVVGAFAFTLSVPLILIGNGIGAIVLRQVTVSNIERIKKYKYLKNGAMYSIFVLGIVMVLHGFHVYVPEWLSPVATIAIVWHFFRKSVLELKREEKTA